VIFALIAWVPLLILSAVQGVLLGNVKIPFLFDPSDYPFPFVGSASDRCGDCDWSAHCRSNNSVHHFRTPSPNFRREEPFVS
jgi:hypothetical protein